MGNAQSDFKKVGDFFEDRYNDVSSWVSDTVQNVVEVTDSAGRWIGETASVITEGFTVAGNWIGDRWTDVVEFSAPIFEEIAYHGEGFYLGLSGAEEEVLKEWRTRRDPVWETVVMEEKIVTEEEVGKEIFTARSGRQRLELDQMWYNEAFESPPFVFEPGVGSFGSPFSNVEDEQVNAGCIIS